MVRGVSSFPPFNPELFRNNWFAGVRVVCSLEAMPSGMCSVLHGTGRKYLLSSSCCSADCLNTASPTKTPAAKKMKAMMSQMTPQTCEGQHPQISANADASLLLTFRAIVSSIVSHKTYMQLMTPMKSTRYRNATPLAMNQKATIRPLIPKIKIQLSQFRRAHHKDNRKTAARTSVATFDASESNPQAMRQAPIKLLPR